MPRIDPLQLLNCLQVLLTPNGGILSKDEVQRLASLMTKFSKKLVSKCVYILILKRTERTLLGAFMGAGGWTLVQVWLHDAICNSNWALVKELLELLLITPVDVERLKVNNIPKMVKSLSKREDLQGVCELSATLVQQWLKIVKDETQQTLQSEISNQHQQIQTITTTSEPMQVIEVPLVQIEQTAETVQDVTDDKKDVTIDSHTFYKLLDRDGKKVLCKVSASEANCTMVENAVIEEVNMEEVKDKEKKEEQKKEKSHNDKAKHRSSSNSSSSSSKSSSGSKGDKGKSKDSPRSKDRHSSSKSKSRDRDKEKDKQRSNGSLKHSSSSSSKNKDKDRKENKEKQAEKDKDTLAKLQPQSLQKLPKIPKKSDDKKKEGSKDKKDDGKDKKDELKKGTISIEQRKNNEERPKTVKIFNSKMRLTGLEEEAKPAPPRPAKKPSTTLPTIPQKRSSPVRETQGPPEKKTKVERTERPGAIKLIPPKPKPPVLQESDMFMDALTASATTKKEPKKRKRRASVSKDSAGSPPQSPSVNATSNSPNSPNVLKSITPPNFYQDTLDTEEKKSENADADDNCDRKMDNKTDLDIENTKPYRSTTPTETNEEIGDDDRPQRDPNGLKGVLVYTKKRGAKKSIRWKPDEQLVEIQYFELDETERVNVTKTFVDMAKMDLQGEREALQMSRKLPNEDLMDSQTPWKVPMELDQPTALVEPGSRSLEKNIQFAREKSVLQALYFSKKMLPDSPAEPDPENHQMVDPVMIPIEDPETPDQTSMTWPDPKSSPPQASVPSIPPIFPNVPNPYPNYGMGPPPPNFSNIQPFAGPGFVHPNMVGNNEWSNMNGINNPPMIPPNMPPPEIMNQGPMNHPNVFGPGMDGFNPMMNDNNGGFPPPFNPGMYPHNNFNPGRGARGPFRRGGGNGPWLRLTAPMGGGWNNQGRGGGNRGGRLCKNVRIHGFCRNRDKCPFIHPMN